MARRVVLGRRQFLAGAAVLGASLALPGLAQARGGSTEVRVDAAIIGGGLGGYAALLALREEGCTVAISSPFPWFGGQLTSQGVPLDEHPWVESIPGSRLYREFRDQLRRWYHRAGDLTPAAATTLWLNPGAGLVGRLCVEPRVAAAVIDEGIAAAGPAGEVVALRGYAPVRVERSGDRITAVILRPVAGGEEIAIVARYFIDATELGDLLELGGVEHVTGAEGAALTGEPSAPPQANPLDQQAITWCFAAEYRPVPGTPLARPALYDTWRAFRPALSPPWPGPLLSWTYSDPLGQQPRTAGLFGEAIPFLTYRRIRAARHFAAGGSDVTLVNWPQNDYFLRPLVGPGVTAEMRLLALGEARDLSRAWLHWLQTEAPRHDGGYGYPELQPRAEMLGTPDGFAMHPYIREGRRLLGLVTVREQHIGVEARRLHGLPTDRATTFADSVGIGYYPLDLHPSTGGHNYRQRDCLPYQIPWGALVPRRVENLLAVGLAIATTQITNGAYRTHASEFATGVAAGYGAAFCLARGATPAQVHAAPALLEAFRDRLDARGVRMAWPASMAAFADLSPHTPGAAAIWCLADQGVVRGQAPDRFEPDGTTSRAEVASQLCRLLGWADERWPNPFTDQGNVAEDTWRHIGTLAGRGVLQGDDTGTFRPHAPLTKVESLAVIARAFVSARRWEWGERPGCFPDLPAASQHRRGVETFVTHTGGIEECPHSDPWPTALAPAPRRWFAAALHLALEHGPTSLVSTTTR